MSEQYSYDIQRRSIRPRRSLKRVRSSASRRLPLRQWIVFGVIGALLAVAAMLLAVFVFIPMGLGTALSAGTVSLLPLVIVAGAIWWLNRFQPQTRGALIFSFAWGAIGSITLTLIAGFAVEMAIAMTTQEPTSTMFLSAVMQAPIVEEAMKGLGLLLLMLAGRHYVSTPVSGVLHAMLIGSGFAFTENITYFGRALAAAHITGSSTDFWSMLFMRGLLSPFAHAVFTSLTGLALGIAAERRSVILGVLLGLGGLGVAMSLHALWNGSAILVSMKNPDAGIRAFLTYYAAVQVPLFLILTAVVLGLVWRQQRVIRRQLSTYAQAGWFSEEEVASFAALRGRRRVRRWAASQGAVVLWAVREMQRIALALAVHRQAMLGGRPTARTRRTERALLEELVSQRRLVSALSIHTAPTSRTIPPEAVKLQQAPGSSAAAASTMGGADGQTA